MTIGAYGKLPFHAEFIRVGALPAETAIIDQYIGEGLHYGLRAIGSAFDATFLNGDLFGFVWKTAPSGRILAGLSKPSRDKAGRVYPFTLFAGFDLGVPFDTVVRGIESLIERGSAFLNRGWTSVDQIAAALSALEDSGPISPEGRIPEMIVTRGDGADRCLFSLLHNLRQVSASVAESPGVQLDYGLGYHVRDPLPRTGAALVWILKLTGAMLSRLNHPTALLWQGWPPCECVVCMKPPHPALFAGLMTRSDMGDHVFWVNDEATTAGTPSRESLPPELLKILQRPTIKLSEIVSAMQKE